MDAEEKEKHPYMPEILKILYASEEEKVDIDQTTGELQITSVAGEQLQEWACTFTKYTV